LHARGNGTVGAKHPPYMTLTVNGLEGCHWLLATSAPQASTACKQAVAPCTRQRPPHPTLSPRRGEKRRKERASCLHGLAPVARAQPPLRGGGVGAGRGASAFGGRRPMNGPDSRYHNLRPPPSGSNDDIFVADRFGRRTMSPSVDGVRLREGRPNSYENSGMRLSGGVVGGGSGRLQGRACRGPR